MKPLNGSLVSDLLLSPGINTLHGTEQTLTYHVFLLLLELGGANVTRRAGTLLVEEEYGK